MSLARIADIPPPPPGKTGWPWTEEVPPLPEAPNGQPWPRISVVTPSYNQGQFIEQTIRSVLLQAYPNLEYIIIDGGSSDESLEVINRYQEHVAYWVSEPDRGQSHAINKGFLKSTGQIMCWLNSDDYYSSGTLQTVAEYLADSTGNFAIVGDVYKVYVDTGRAILMPGRYRGRERLLQFWRGYEMPQPSIFWRREVFDKVGLLDEELHYIMDFDYWARISEHFDFKNVDRSLSYSNYHDRAKTGDNYVRYHEDLRKYAHAYWGSPFSVRYWRLQSSMLITPAYRAVVKSITTRVRPESKR
jgi:glycosyltransferase involved in cell wall biosynthesis